MRLTVDFRTELNGVSTWITEQFDHLIAQIKGTWGIEHDADGHHLDITAHSLTLTKSVTDGWTGAIVAGGGVTAGGDGVFNGDVKADADGTPVQIGALSAILAGEIGHLGAWFGSATDGIVLARRTKGSQYSGGGSYSFVIYDLAKSTSKPVLELAQDGGVPTITDGGSGSTLGLGNGARPIASLFLNSYSVGTWTDVTYAAGNFTGSGGMTWGVDSADQTTYAYTVVANTLVVVFNIGNTDVTAPVGISLQIKVPGGYTAAKQAANPILVTDAGGAQAVGYAIVTAGGTNILCRKIDNSNWTATAGDNTNVSGMIVIPI